MSVLVTGGTGVFGGHVLRELVQLGYRPIAVDRLIDTTLIRDIMEKVTLVQGDVLDIPFLFETAKKYNVTSIAHLSALMPPLCQAYPPLALEVNVKGTLNLLEVAKVNGIQRFVYTSTKGIFGEIKSPYGYPEYKPLTEAHPLSPDSVYDATKYAGELLGQNYEKNYGIQFLSLRFSSSYGPGKLSRHGPMAVHSKVIENAMCGIPTVIPQGAQEIDDMIYVKDVAHSIVCALFAKDPKSRIFNIGTGQGVTIQEFADVVKQAFPEAEINIGPGLKYMGKNVASYYSIYDISRARRELGYIPSYNLERGIADYIATMKLLGLDPVATASVSESDLLT